MSKVYPVCVIGGGSAGVMATLRTVLNNDECLLFPGSPKDRKKSRAFWVAKVENVPAHHEFKKGIMEPNNDTLKWIAESEFSENLHLMKNRGVKSVSKDEDGLFHIVDSKDEEYKARFVILCTGVMDVQPEINGSIDPILPYANVQIADYCIRCDGHHVLNKEVTVIGGDDTTAWVGFILHERYPVKSMTILTNGENPEYGEKTKKLLEAYNFKIEKSPIVEVKGNAKEKDLQGYVLEDGTEVKSNFTFISLGMIVYNELAKQLGADLDERGFVLTDERGLSSVENLYVAGDLRANAKKQIYTAWDHAVDSSDSINSILRREKREKLLSEL